MHMQEELYQLLHHAGLTESTETTAESERRIADAEQKASEYRTLLDTAKEHHMLPPALIGRVESALEEQRSFVEFWRSTLERGRSLPGDMVDREVDKIDRLEPLLGQFRHIDAAEKRATDQHRSAVSTLIDRISPTIGDDPRLTKRMAAAKRLADRGHTWKALHAAQTAYRMGRERRPS